MRLPNGYGGVIKLSGKRRRPYAARITVGWHEHEITGKRVQEYQIIGYAKTRQEALDILANYNKNPISMTVTKLTFKDVYTRWSEEKYPTISKSNITGYKAVYKLCDKLNDKPFKDLKLDDLQRTIDTCEKNYPTLRKLKVLFNQLYDYAMKHEICYKDYSQYVNIIKYKERNPNKSSRDKFSHSEIDRLWLKKSNPYYQVILMLIYNGVRISELLNLKKENINLKEQYFEVIKSKTENGIRQVPIADAVLPFYKEWYNSNPKFPYLLYTTEGRRLEYRNYYKHYFTPLMEKLHIEKTPHCCRHTCVSMLVEADVSQTLIKTIVGHTGAMSLTEKVYTHLDIDELVDAVNKMYVPESI